MGTRYEHYRDMFDLWEDALAMLMRMYDASPHPVYAKKIFMLSCALDALRIQIDVLCGYKSHSSHDRIEDAYVKPPENDNRGTPLKQEERYDDDDLLGLGV